MFGRVSRYSNDMCTFVVDMCAAGPGMVLGQAGPTTIYTDSGLPATGLMSFDVEDVGGICSFR
jgi:hypothetical protein